MKKILFSILLLLLGQTSAMDPPVMEWEMQFYPSFASVFRCVLQLPDESYLLAGGIWSGMDAFLVRMNTDGDLLWTSGNDWYGQYAYSTSQLPDGGFIATGSCTELSSSSGELFIARMDSCGDIQWDKVYDVPGSNEAGYAITQLPDGGYAVSGRVNSTSSQNGQAWILRMDSQGDTLWSDIWGTHTLNHSKGILYSDGKLVVLAQGSGPGLPYGAHLLFYDLDGNYLYGTSYAGTEGYAVDICHAQDGGFTFCTDGTDIVHTDSLGTMIWNNRRGISDLFVEYKWASISLCMDGGYILAGSYKSIWQPDAHSDYSAIVPGYDWDVVAGWMVRLDQMGQQLWEVYLLPGGSDQVELYSARQLSEGGYIASGYYNDVGGTGVDGYIVRYAPETGIAEWEESTGETLSLRSWPNPSDGPVQISLTGPEGLYSLTVHDLAGRLVREYPEVPLGGAAALVWDGLSDSGSSLPAGVYIADLHTTAGSVSTLLMRL